MSRGTHREAREEGEGPGTDGRVRCRQKGKGVGEIKRDVVCRVCPGLTGKDGMQTEAPHRFTCDWKTRRGGALVVVSEPLDPAFLKDES